jgi:hypothetical protein
MKSLAALGVSIIDPIRRVNLTRLESNSTRHELKINSTRLDMTEIRSDPINYVFQSNFMIYY